MMMVPAAKLATPVTPATVTDEPDPETTMVLATRRSRIVLQRAAIHHRERAAVDQDTLAKAVHGERAAIDREPAAEQLHSVRSPPIVPMLPPLLRR